MCCPIGTPSADAAQTPSYTRPGVGNGGSALRFVDAQATRVLTPVAGCLADWSRNAGARGVTHTLNPFIGCPIGALQCGKACYARHLQSWARKGHRPDDWGTVAYLKQNAAERYLKEVRTSSGGDGTGIFMSSVTEPLPPQKKARAVTHRLLKAMVERPPGRGLIIQTHTSYAAAPEILEVLQELSQRTSVLVSISVETNRERILGLKSSCCSISKRIKAFETLSSHGIATQASVSPLMPCDPEVFARMLREAGVWRVILDHWQVGDGSGGSRTESVGVPQLLTSHGYDPKWCSAAILDELQPIFAAQNFPGGVGRKPDYFAYIPEQSKLRRYFGDLN